MRVILRRCFFAHSADVWSGVWTTFYEVVLSSPELNLLDSDLLSLSNVGEVRSKSFGGIWVLYFLSFISRTVLYLSKVDIGAIKQAEVNSPLIIPLSHFLC